MEQSNAASKILISLTLFFSSPIYSDTCNVAPIKKGVAAPCDGFYFNKDAEHDAEQYRDDAIFYKSYSDKINEKVKLESDENDVLQKRVNLYLQESKTLADEVSKRDNNEGLYRFGYFLLGIVVTGLAVRNIRP